MILSDKTLKKLIKDGVIGLTPLDEKAIQGASIDCKLGNHFLIADEHLMDKITLDDPIKYREITADKITIPPRSFILGTTVEYVKLPDDITVFIEGRSSIGRMGLFIQNAGWVDPGFEGRLTLELYNATSLPIILESGRRICQFVFCKMDTKADLPYGAHPQSGKYQGQDTTVGSRVYEDFENK